MEAMNSLTRYLKENDLTQAAFAERVGLRQATVSKVCAGKVGVSLATALRIERATGGAVPVSVWSETERASA